MRKIKVLIPNAGMPRETLDERANMLSAPLDAGTQVCVDCISGGPETIESHTDEILAERDILQGALAAEREGFDAFVIYCFSDPGLLACRELVSIPIVGPGEASLSLATTLAHSYSVITTRPDNVLRTRMRLEKSPYAVSLKSVRSLGIDVASLREDEAATRQALESACRLCVEEDGSGAIVLGCLGMASYGEKISKELGVPVLDPAFIAVATAEMLIKLGISQSKKGWPSLSSATLALLNNNR